MTEEVFLWREALRGNGACLWISLGLLAASLLAAGMAVVAAPRMRSPRGRCLALGPAVVLTVPSALLVGARLADFRTQHLAWTTLGPPDVGSLNVVHPLLGQFFMVSLTPVVLGLAVPTTLVAFGRTYPRARWMLYGISAISAATAASAAWLAACWPLFLFRSFGPRQMWSRIVEDWEPTTWAPGLVAIVGFGLLALLRWRSRDAWTTSWRAPAAAALFAAFGVAAFLGTRAHAHDRRHWISLRGDGQSRAIPAAPSKLPDGACHAPGIALALDFTGMAAQLNRRIVTPETLHTDLDVYRRHWPVLRPNEPYPNALRVIARPDMAWPELEPWLAIAYDAGYRDVRLAFLRTRIVRTAALGAVSVPVRCDVSVTPSTARGRFEHPHLLPDAVAHERWRTVGDAVRAAAKPAILGRAL